MLTEITENIEKYTKSIRSQFEDNLKLLVDIPSVSCDPAHKGDIERAALAAVDMLNAAGAQASAMQTFGNPIVMGELKAGPAFPTITVYNHLDVQPANETEWKQPPFMMHTVGDTYLGRGTTDDKGPALTALYAARFCAANKVPLNIRFLWELEEEIGSPSFEECVRTNQSRLKTDSVVVSDTVWVSRQQPAIPCGLRGLQAVLLRLTTGKKDVHSGLTGGLARNPVGELAQLISECYDARTGSVKIPGFYDNVVPASDKELDEFESSGFSIGEFKRAYELLSLRFTDPREGAGRVWAMPTFEVHGITGGYHGPGTNTIVPHAAEAKISMRLVPNQKPQDILEMLTKFVHTLNPDVEVIADGSLKPYLSRPSGIYADAAKAAVKKAFGKEPVFTREGGSIGAVVSMHEIFQCPIIFLGLSLPEHGYHAVNENYDWQQASGGIKMFAEYFTRIARS